MGAFNQLGWDRSVELAFSVLIERAKRDPNQFLRTLLAMKQDDPSGVEAFRKAAADALGDVAAAVIREILQLGKLNSAGVVYAGRRDIGEGLQANFFAIPKSLRDMTGGIYTCDDTIGKVSEGGGFVAKWSVGGKDYQSDCFASNPDNYRQDSLEYLRAHIRKHEGDPSAYSKAVIPPYVDILQGIVRHKLDNTRSDFVLPKNRGSDDGDVIQSSEPHRSHPGSRKVVFGTGGHSAWGHRDSHRFGALLLVAAPC